MDTIFKTLFLRQPLLHYVSPPVCENLFSSSSGPIIVLNSLERQSAVTGGVAGGAGNFHLTWGAYPGALCYSVYKATDPNNPFGEYVIVAECIPNPEYDATDSGDGYYVVTALTPEGETPFSDPINVEKVPAQCPSFIGASPELLVSAEDGANVVLGPFDVNEGIGFGTVFYKWFKDSVFFRDTTGSTLASLHLDNVSNADIGEYTLQLTNNNPDCFIESDTITLDVEGCVPSEGSVAPEGETAFDIEEEVERAVVSSATFSIDPGDDFTNPAYYTEVPVDMPPGVYQLVYDTGYYRYFASEQYFSYAALIGAYDDEHSYVDFSKLVGNVYRIGPPPVDTHGSGVYEADDPDFDVTQAAFDSYFNGSQPKRWWDVATHTNTGGPIKVYWEYTNAGLDNFPNPPELGRELVVKLVQISGLILQPKSLDIVGWPKSTTDPAINANWDGVFPTRTQYTSATCVYDVPAAGAFGGATVEYSQDVTEAENACGWLLTIRKGVDIYWQGVKTVGNTAVGVYMRREGYSQGPGCFTLEEHTP